MKSNKKAFTLIELLVVVLIIGILAAIALPQYQFAVMKARAGEGFILGKAAYNAQENYTFISGGDWATSADMLDISFPSASFNNDNGYANIVMDNFDISMRPSGKTIYVRSFAGRTAQSISYELVFSKGPVKCRAWQKRSSLEKAEKLCIALGGKNRTVVHATAVDFTL
jgi:type IV pilus assembly protein PilE